MQVLNSGDLSAVQNLSSVQNLVDNPDMQAMAETLGWVDEGETLQADQLASSVTSIWGRVQSLRSDPEIAAVLNDPPGTTASMAEAVFR